MVLTLGAQVHFVLSIHFALKANDTLIFFLGRSWEILWFPRHCSASCIARGEQIFLIFFLKFICFYNYKNRSYIASSITTATQWFFSAKAVLHCHTGEWNDISSNLVPILLVWLSLGLAKQAYASEHKQTKTVFTRGFPTATLWLKY